MSYCTVEQLGTVRWGKGGNSATASIAAVKSVAEAIDRMLGYNALYDSAEWTISPVRAIILADGKLSLDLGFPMIEITSVKYFDAPLSPGTVLTPRKAITNATIDAGQRWWDGAGDLLSAVLLNYGNIAQDIAEAPGRVLVNGIRGVGSMGTAYASAQPLKAGQTVLRPPDMNPLLIESDQTGHIGDIPIAPPPLLQNIAIGLGRRLVRMQNDQTAGITIENLLAGYESVLRHFNIPQEYRGR